MQDMSPIRSRRAVAVICVALFVPFMFVTIPPLTDVPGHIGRAAIAALAPESAAFRMLFTFRWYPVPNLGADLIVEGLRHWIGIVRAYWLVAACIPPLIGLGVLGVARTLNPRGSAAIGWALMFVYSYPFSYGFLNYMLAAGLSLIGLVAWIRLDARPVLREAATWIAVPLLFLCHAVGGSMFTLFVASREFSKVEGGATRASIAAFLRRVRPLASAAVIIVAWRLTTHTIAGVNEIGVKQKLNAVVMLLRDQNIWLDTGSLVAAIAVFAVGHWKGARVHRAVIPAILFLIPLFIVMPSRLTGSHFADMRLLPLIPMLAFAAQDWRAVSVRLSRVVAISGLALFAGRLTVTTAGFIDYDRSYRHELAAVAHIAPLGRVIALNTANCDARADWRSDRLTHFGELATVYRGAWTNGQWDTDGGHLLTIAYRPSPDFYHDPSQRVWPAGCVGGGPDRRTIEDALARMPFDRIDYLWTIRTRLPAGYSNPRLTLLWSNGGSALYAVRGPSRRSRAVGPR